MPHTARLVPEWIGRIREDGIDEVFRLVKQERDRICILRIERKVIGLLSRIQLTPKGVGEPSLAAQVMCSSPCLIPFENIKAASGGAPFDSASSLESESQYSSPPARVSFRSSTPPRISARA